MKSYPALLAAIGNTPLVQIPFESEGKCLAKLEYLNPDGSVKDRSALYMIEEAERAGELRTGGTIIEASSGNQGIAVAMIGAAKGYKVIITVSEKISREKLQTIEAYGAKVITCPATDFIADPKGYHSEAALLQKQTPNSIFLNQYFNPRNPQAHFLTLGPEIWEQTGEKITHFFAAAGTGGVVSGVGRFLKSKNPNIKVVAVDAATSFHATLGMPKPYRMEGIGIDFKSPCLDESVVDEFISVSDEQGLGILRALSTKYGFLVGPSSGAVAYAVGNYKLADTDIAVMIFADSGRAYL